MAKKRVYDNKWLFNGQEFDEELAQQYHGFVYILTEIETGKRYIGKKSFWSNVKPKGATRRKKVESDWRYYYSSSKQIKEIVKEKGNNSFKREIIALCKLERYMNYLEVKYQFQFNILEEPDGWFNENINGCWYPHLYSDISSNVDLASM